MRVIVAYALVLMVWSTTPLAIKWSNDSISFAMAAALRMTLALAVGFLLISLLRRPMVWRGRWHVFAAASLTLFPTMPFIYWAAQYIPSGVISVVFGLAPFVTGLGSVLVLRDNPFTALRVVALLLALSGLVVVFYDQLQFGRQAAWGVAAVVIGTSLFSLTNVLLKKINDQGDIFSQNLGAMLCSLPGLWLVWALSDGSVPEFSVTSLTAVSYLALFGSLVGFSAYIYIVRHMAITTVALIPLMAPVIAMALGALLAGEPISPRLALGAGLIIAGLLLYQWRLLVRREAEPPATPG